ncbi:MAG: hypothetical protein LC790_14510 [Actinobacteria bacterium]|nr:hypothetical protein [Actinomycetota bacterium]
MSVDMTDGICFAGLDVDARKTAAAAVKLGSGEVFKAQLSGSPRAVIEWLVSLPGAGPAPRTGARAPRRTCPSGLRRADPGPGAMAVTHAMRVSQIAQGCPQLLVTSFG